MSSEHTKKLEMVRGLQIISLNKASFNPCFFQTTEGLCTALLSKACACMQLSGQVGELTAKLQDAEGRLSSLQAEKAQLEAGCKEHSAQHAAERAKLGTELEALQAETEKLQATHAEATPGPQSSTAVHQPYI